MPFAPLLARLAKADVSISTTLLVVLTVATIIALPLGLPLAIDAVDAQLKASVWDVAWCQRQPKTDPLTATEI
jgi:BASS family bile acid:Na+ symporter